MKINEGNEAQRSIKKISKSRKKSMKDNSQRGGRISIKKTICNMKSPASETFLEVRDGLPEVLVP